MEVNNKTPEELEQIIATNTDAKVQVDALRALGSSLTQSNPERAIQFCEEAINIAQKNGNWEGEGYTMIVAAFAYLRSSNKTESFELYQKALKLFESAGNKKGAAICYSNSGYAYSLLGDYTNAIKHQHLAVSIGESIGNISIMAMCTLKLGEIFTVLEDCEKALEYYQKALKYYETIEENKGIALSIFRSGEAYHGLDKLDKALECYKQAYSIGEKTPGKYLHGPCLVQIATVYSDTGDYPKALEYLDRGRIIIESSKNQNDIAIVHSKYSEVYNGTGNLQKAIEYMQKAIYIQTAIGAIGRLPFDWHRQLAEFYGREGNWQKAFEEHKLYVEIKSKVKSDEAQKTAANLEIQKQLIKAETEHEVTTRMLVEVEKAKEKVEEKNREILDSINYATRIQSTILPPLKVVKSYLNQSFVLYLPKDIVAGDFYWMEAAEKEHTVFFAVCDCTGHGVPGAMVSVVCHNALNATVREYGLKQPAQILDKAAELITRAFSLNNAEGDEIKDGMDASVCALHTDTMRFQWAGANSPLWIIKPSSELIEYKGNNQSVGRVHKLVPFTNHEIVLEKGDTIYLLSDGFADQFGGENNKKFQRKALKELLVSVCEKSMDEQRAILYKAFESWRGKNNQTDDVCVIGVRMN